MQGGGEPQPVSLALATLPGEAGATVQLIPQASARRRVTTLAAWAFAWANYLEVAAYFRPEWVSAFLSYQTMIFNFASLYPAADWIRYDALFRTAAARQPALVWDRPDERLFALCLSGRASVRLAGGGLGGSSGSMRCFQCQGLGHRASACPQSRFARPVPPRAPQGLTRPALPSGSSGPMICRNFNSRGVCEYTQCKFSHVCELCGLAHPRVQCSSNQ